MKRAHTDEEIIRAASLQEKRTENILDNRADVAIDLDDEHGIMHTYVVTFSKEGDSWKASQVSELSSL